VHKHRNLLAHAPERLHDEISADYKDMIYADTREEIETRRKAFIRKWRRSPVKCEITTNLKSSRFKGVRRKPGAFRNNGINRR
jgi:transposase-like protein